MPIISFLIVVALLALALTPTVYCIYNLVRRRRSWKWWIVTFLFFVAGCFIGIKFVNIERQNAAKTRRYPGLPLPYVVFAWEEDHWTDFVFPAPTAFAIFGFDFSAGLGLAMTPLAIRLRRDGEPARNKPTASTKA
jgi:uncharacterized membrane protein YbhN (UPF0104 family)